MDAQAHDDAGGRGQGPYGHGETESGKSDICVLGEPEDGHIRLPCLRPGEEGVGAAQAAARAVHVDDLLDNLRDDGNGLLFARIGRSVQPSQTGGGRNVRVRSTRPGDSSPPSAAGSSSIGVGLVAAGGIPGPTSGERGPRNTVSFFDRAADEHDDDRAPGDSSAICSRARACRPP